MAQFPDLLTLDKSDSGEFIYGGSVGVNRILGFYREVAFASQRVEWAAHCINLFTVTRNIFTKTASKPELNAAFLQDVRLLVQYIQAYASHARNAQARDPLIVFYAPDYQALPDDARRPQAEGARLLQEAYQFLIHGFQREPYEYQPKCWQIHAGDGARLPHQELERFLRRRRPTIAQEPVLLITHCATDYHLARSLPQLTLLESYTGHTRSPQQFGDRIEPSGVVPFTPYTHRVLGDSVHLAPMVRGPVKKALLSRAAERRWHTRTDQEILQDLQQVTGLPVDEIRRIKF